MVATLKDIANKVGKSITTVSRALHGYDDVNPETRDNILKVADELGYKPNVLAQRLQKKTSDTIGFIIPTFGPRFSDPFFSEFLAGIGNKANSFGFDIIVSTQSPGDKEIATYQNMVQSRKVDGFICVRTRRQDDRIEYLRSVNFPFVSFGASENIFDSPWVDEDNQDGMKQVAQHLVDLNFKRIACIAPNQDFMFAYSRLSGLRESLTKMNIEIPQHWIKIGDLTQNGGYKQASILLDLDNPPDAIVACNDLMALGAIRAAQERNLVVGKDVAITGFDDIPLSEHIHPPLTTVRQPIYQIGGIVCEMLIKTISGEKLEQNHVLLKPLLVVRNSCGEKPTNLTTNKEVQHKKVNE